jgi:hypothetical protein
MAPAHKENVHKKPLLELKSGYVHHKDAELGDILQQCRKAEVSKTMDADMVKYFLLRALMKRSNIAT